MKGQNASLVSMVPSNRASKVSRYIPFVIERPIFVDDPQRKLFIVIVSAHRAALPEKPMSTSDNGSLQRPMHLVYSYSSR